MSEAQLIGRGARYFPFRQSETDDKYCRKFDNDLLHDLRVLEELHYHSVNDSRYISEIHAALVGQGMMDEKIVTREIKLKDEFKKTEFYQKGVIWMNEQVQRDNRHLKSFDDLPKKLSVKEKHHEHTDPWRHWRRRDNHGVTPVSRRTPRSRRTPTVKLYGYVILNRTLFNPRLHVIRFSSLHPSSSIFHV